MRIRTKILTGFILMAFIGGILGAVGLVSINMLTAMAGELQTMQLENSEVVKVLNAHYVWRQELTETALTGQAFAGSLDPAACALGKWKDSEEANAITDTEIIGLISRVNEPHNYIHNRAQEIIDYAQAGDTEKAAEQLVSDMLPRTREVINLLARMEERFTELVEEKSEETVNLGNTLRLITAAFTVVAAIAGVLLSLFVASSILKPIKKVTEAAEKIAGGDMDIQLEYKIKDQIGSLVSSFRRLAESTKEQAAVAERMANRDLRGEVKPRSEKDVMSFAIAKMLHSLNTTFYEINRASAEVDTGAGQVAAGAQTLASGSAQQAAAIGELSDAMTKVSGMAKANTKNAANVLRDVQQAGQLMGVCTEQMRQMTEAMRAIDEKSHNIAKTAKLIDDIAFQTNILALNATVEAARAGQYGSGFAVVAGEVRGLASKSAEAARETDELIKSSVRSVEEGSRIVTKVSASLLAMGEITRRNEEEIVGLQAVSAGQSEAMERINFNVDQIAQVVQRNSATAEESAAASEEMSGQSAVLHDLVEQFKLRSGNEGRVLSASADRERGLSIVGNAGKCDEESGADYGGFIPGDLRGDSERCRGRTA